MSNDYIYRKVESLVRKFHTRDPIKILEALHVVVGESSSYNKLKGYRKISRLYRDDH